MAARRGKATGCLRRWRGSQTARWAKSRWVPRYAQASQHCLPFWLLTAELLTQGSAEGVDAVRLQLAAVQLRNRCADFISEHR